MDLDAVADELYGLPPGDFTAARDARAGEARRAGDRDLAGAIAKLHRPTRGAWLVNALVRARPEQAAAVAQLGTSMREAQDRLDGAELRRLASERAALLRDVAREAPAVAAGAGQAVTDEMVEELQTTIEAALADEASAGVLRAARLVTGLSYSGLGSLAGAGAVAAPRAPARSARGRQPTPDPEAPRDGTAKEDARAALDEAAAAAGAARLDAEEAERAAAATAERIAEVDHELAGLRAELEELGRRRDLARRSLRLAEERLQRAGADLERAD